MKDAGFPDLQDLDSLHLEDYQSIQEKMYGQDVGGKKNNLYYSHSKPDLSPQNPCDNYHHGDPFRFALSASDPLISSCATENLYIPHFETLEYVFSSLHSNDGIELDELQMINQDSPDNNFPLQQQHRFSLDSSLSPESKVAAAFDETGTLEASRSTSTTPPMTVKNQKRSSSFEPDDVFSTITDDSGKKKKWCDTEAMISSISKFTSFGSSSELADWTSDTSPPKAAFEKPTAKTMTQKQKDGETDITGATGDKLPRHKRPSHINAEVRRRSKIQHCLDQLNEMVPCVMPESAGQQNSSMKKSKASVLFKTATCTRYLKSKTREVETETDALRAEIKTLCKQIKEYQMRLPENGVNCSSSSSSSSSSTSLSPASLNRTNITVDQRFEDYVHISTLRNWKFWTFSIFTRPLFTSYWNATGQMDSVDDFRRQIFLWLRDECRLSNLRGAITDALLTVSSRTSIVTNPSSLPVESIRESMRDAGIDMLLSSLRPTSR